jgi:hypothetical protein
MYYPYAQVFERTLVRGWSLVTRISVVEVGAGAGKGGREQMKRAPDLIGARWFFEEADLSQPGITLVALSDLEIDLLAFVKCGGSGTLDFGVMDEQVITFVIGDDKPKALVLVKPFYCTCTHNSAPLA